MIVAFILVYSILFAFLISTRYINGLKKYYTLGKTLNSIGFILVALYGSIAFDNEVSFYYMLPALVLCLCGDVFLGIHTQTDNEKCFLAGIFSFMTAHIGYTYAFSKISPLNLYDFIIPVISVFLTIQFSKLKNMEINKEFKKCVFIYSFFVALLLSKSMNILYVVGLTTNSFLIFLGSLMFFISDFIILFLYFYKKKHHLVGTFNLLFYYYGMLIIAFSLWF